MTTTLTIFKQAGSWVVVRDGRRCGEYRFKVDAEEAALHRATKCEAEGFTATVLSQGEFGEIVPLVEPRRATASDRMRAVEKRSSL